jgi:hypothetical protein
MLTYKMLIPVSWQEARSRSVQLEARQLVLCGPREYPSKRIPHDTEKDGKNKPEGPQQALVPSA